MRKAARNNNTLDEKCTTLGWEPLQFLLSDRNCIQSTLIKIYKECHVLLSGENYVLSLILKL